MKTVQDELLLDLEAIEGVADPLIPISSSGQQMSMIQIIVTVCGPQNVLLPGYTVSSNRCYRAFVFQTVAILADWRFSTVHSGNTNLSRAPLLPP